MYEPHDLLRFMREETRIALESEAHTLGLGVWWGFWIGWLTGQALPLGLFL